MDCRRTSADYTVGTCVARPAGNQALNRSLIYGVYGAEIAAERVGHPRDFLGSLNVPKGRTYKQSSEQQSSHFDPLVADLTAMKTVLLAVVCVALCGSAMADVKQIPEKFLGSWTVDHSDNFDEYLTAKGTLPTLTSWQFCFTLFYSHWLRHSISGYGWFMRQMVKLASITKVFSKTAEPGVYDCKILTTKKNVEWKGFKLDEEFQAEYLDDSQHKVGFK